jgi:hypothetical protein
VREFNLKLAFGKISGKSEGEMCVSNGKLTYLGHPSGLPDSKPKETLYSFQSCR